MSGKKQLAGMGVPTFAYAASLFVLSLEMVLPYACNVVIEMLLLLSE
jgi:hypothetical protein